MQLDRAECDRFLDEACSSDGALRAELQSLMAAQRELRPDFLQSPPLGGSGPAAAGTLSPPALEAGQIFAERFVLVRKLGEGGMGVVWLAEQTAPVRRQVAVKLIRAGMYDELSAHRFQSEMQSLAMMDHPAIAKVFDAGTTQQGQPYFVMELVAGQPITQYCDQRRLAIRERLALFIKACEAVQHAHEKAIVHRDLKPGNILVAEVDGKPAPRIIDFGVAKTISADAAAPSPYTHAGFFLGTPGYMSPEQADPSVADIDARADVYALGVMLYVLLSGYQPFETGPGEKPSLEQWLRQLREDEPTRPSAKLRGNRAHSVATAQARSAAPKQLAAMLRGDLDWITLKALEKDRTRRYSTAAELAADLRRYLDDQPVSARPVDPLYRLYKYVRRHRAAAGAATGLVLLLTGFSVLLYNVGHRRSTAPVTERSRVLLAGLANSTGDSALDAVAGKVLDIGLAQSPFLDLIPPPQVAKTLQLMERPKDELLSRELAQEVCLRNQGRAVLSGTIDALGNRYLVTLEAADCVTGEHIVQSKAEADRREDVPRALDGLISQMRESLGESLVSVQQFDVPIEQATTASFEALRAYSVGERARLQGDNATAIPLFKHAIELDPSFALAYAELAAAYVGARESELARPYYQKAFELKARVSENEKQWISANYYQALGDFGQAINSYRTWTQLYPRDARPWASLANLYTSNAQYEHAIDAGKEALRLNPDDSRAYIVLARAYKRLSRFEEASAVGRQAMAKGLGGWDLHCLMYEVAYARGDRVAMAEQVANETGKPGEVWMLEYQADGAATEGKIGESRALFERAIALAQAGDADGRDSLVSGFVTDYIDVLSNYGLKVEANKLVTKTLRLDENDEAPVALAQVGDFRRARELEAALGKRYPSSTQINGFYRPLAQAEIALGEGRPRDAIAALQKALPVKLQTFDVPYLLARAYMDIKAPAQAAAQYREILDNRGVDALSPLYPLACLGLARAERMQGKADESRRAYERFFKFWRDADRDNPILLRAQAEYARLGKALN